MAPSSVGEHQSTTTANDLKPSECSGITLVNKLVSSGTATGTADNDLMLGSSGVDMFDGAGGNDCIVGGDDSLAGGPGTDTCYGGPGNDSFADDCENKIQ